MADDLLHVGEHAFDPDDLTFGEKREVRRLIRSMWDEDTDGPFDWDEVGENEVLPATICVFMRRHESGYAMEQAMACKSVDVYGDEGESDPTPAAPAEPASPKRASRGARKTPASSGA